VNTLTILDQSISEDQFTDTSWLRYFDIKQALRAVHAHIAALPSDRTPERHTRNLYVAGIKYFLEWAGGSSLSLPTADLIAEYIAHLSKEKEWTRGGKTYYGISTASIASRYIAPLRIFLTKLAGQKITGVHGIERDFVTDCREHIRAAIAVKPPRNQETTNIAPLWNPKFTRLTLTQVNAVLRACNTKTLPGLRDYVIMRTAFETAFRLSELGRITPNSITLEGDNVLITVRGKRSNIDPIAISHELFSYIKQYVNLYNALAGEQAQHIEDDIPIIQSLLTGGHIPAIGATDSGMTGDGLRRLIWRRTAGVLGDEYGLKPHDTRRTFAAIAYEMGMPLPDIAKALRHKDSSVTLHYIGQKPDYDSTLITNYVKIG